MIRIASLLVLVMKMSADQMESSIPHGITIFFVVFCRQLSLSHPIGDSSVHVSSNLLTLTYKYGVCILSTQINRHFKI